VEDVGPRLPEGVVRLAPARHQAHLALKHAHFFVVSPSELSF
jgi:hypothetical protein